MEVKFGSIERDMSDKAVAVFVNGIHEFMLRKMEDVYNWYTCEE